MWGEVFIRPEHYRHETVADWATGAAMLVSDRCVAACGRWDESFFLYSEETEYCLRARDQGFELVLCPAVTAVHLGGESKVSPRLRTLLVVNRLRLYARARSRAATTMFWLVAVAREASRTLRGRPASREVLVALLSRRRMRCARQAVSGSSGTLTTGRSDAVG
jgi:GT2 family glycosyltransferase